MSGIVGIVQFDGSPLDPVLLRRLNHALEFRGPDAQRIWTKNDVGLGHTLFRTTDESDHDCQPLTLDGHTWIVADARIDAREDLFAALRTAGENDLSESNWTDAELILRSYRCWGQDCVERLLGDFAFGIWNDARRELFCARDHMGVKSFYYAHLGPCVIFSNTLDCIRQHPGISDNLNDLAIADFLLFEFNQEPATTSFKDIHRLPSAHCGVWSRAGFKARRYWSMPVEGPLFYKRAGDYVDRLQELLYKSVADRLRTPRIWIFMSGGIDSPALAATARGLMRARYSDFDLQALTKIDSFVPEEAQYAELVADHLGLPIFFRRWTEATNLGWEQKSFLTSEPLPHAWVIPADQKFWKECETHSRVFFYGEGPDNALHCDWVPYISGLWKHGSYGALLSSVLSALFSERRPPFWGRISSRARMIGRTGFHTPVLPAFPEWLNPNLESRLSLRERWNAARSPTAVHHPWRPGAYASLQSPLWQSMFENLDAAAAEASYEMRYPFVDIRMLRFLLSLPALPWCRSKRLLRLAMRNRLPDKILRRKKRGIDQRLVFKYIEELCGSPLTPVIDLANYLSLDRLPTAISAYTTEGNLRVRILNHWLRYSRPSPHNLPQETSSDRSA